MASNTISSDLRGNIIGATLEALRGTSAFAGSVNKDFDGSAGKIGDKVRIAVPVPLTAANVTPSNTSPDASAINVTNKEITIDQFKRTIFKLEGTETQENDLSNWFRQQITECVEGIVSAFNQDLHSKYIDIPNFVGESNDGFFEDDNGNNLAEMTQVLRENKVPLMDRKFICSPADEKGAGQAPYFQQANTFGSRDIIGMGDVAASKIMGYDVMVDQDVVSHTVGTITTGLATKAATTQAVGVTELVCTTAASTGAAALKAGDIVTVDSVNYSLAEDATQASAATDVTLTLDRGLEIEVTGGEAVTIATNFGTSTQNIGGDLTGISVVNRMPTTNIFGVSTMGDHIEIVDPVTGFNILATFYGQDHQVAFAMASIWGGAVTDSRRLVRGLSNTA